MKNIILIFIVFTSLFSCKKETPKKSNYMLLQKTNWFLGNWQNTSPEADFREIWKSQNDSTFAGKSFVIVQKDTVFYENIVVQQRNDTLFYTVSVKDQNTEKPVPFYMTSANIEQVVFENPKHDFPNKIIYTKITNDTIVAEIFGTKKGKYTSEAFPMYKK